MTPDPKTLLARASHSPEIAFLNWLEVQGALPLNEALKTCPAHYAEKAWHAALLWDLETRMADKSLTAQPAQPAPTECHRGAGEPASDEATAPGTVMGERIRQEGNQRTPEERAANIQRAKEIIGGGGLADIGLANSMKEAAHWNVEHAKAQARVAELDRDLERLIELACNALIPASAVLFVEQDKIEPKNYATFKSAEKAFLDAACKWHARRAKGTK